MPLIYVTGVPGAGKSSVREELLRRGYKAYGGVEDDIAAFYNNETGERVEGWVEAKDRTTEWKAKHAWKITHETAEELKEQAKNELIFLCAVTRNDVSELWDLFDKVIALTIDEATLKQRLASRTNNDIGKTPDELQDILKHQQTASEDYKKLGATLVEASRPIDEVVDEIIGVAKYMKPSSAL